MNPPHDTPSYELSQEQNVDMRSIGTHAIVWGGVCGAVAVLCLALSVAGAAGKLHGPGWRLYAPIGAVNAILAINFVIAGRDFRAAIHRPGCDITHVMAGLSHLSRAVQVQIVVALVFVAVVTAATLFFGGS